MRRFALVAMGLWACDGGEKVSVVGVDVADEDSDVGDSPDTLDPGTAWVWSSHPCAGNRTDAMLVHPNGSIWVGCGTTTEGNGLYVSGDGGLTWDPPGTSPDDYFRAFRVDDLSLATDGLLYVAGEYTGNGARVDDAVVALDPRSDPSLLPTIFEVGDQTWNSFSVGTFRRLTSGFAVAESLTGTGVVWRASDADPWQDGYGWWPAGDSFQILDMEIAGDRLVACGSTIAQPPHVFVQDDQPGLHLTPVQLADFDGEMWDIVADDQGVWVGGVDQDADEGVAFVSGADLLDPGAWLRIDLGELLPGESTWIEGLCRRGDAWAIVGRYSQRGDALALWSDDAGESWTEISPEGVGALSVCHIGSDGRMVATGAEGAIGWFDPTP
ncbi:MAG TPA: hypothetical protein PKA64_04910 [Myxococcota bacterium]|nr:hypothetical protein [Myxococcota bacterium]